MTELTFFMIVTPRDAVIADYAVRSYRKIEGIDFRLKVYSNYLLPEQKDYYFHRWESDKRVEVVKNDYHDEELGSIRSRISTDNLQGPFEFSETVWDRELRKIESPFVATVDSDFEVLSQRFAHHIMDRLRSSGDDVVGFSTDYSPTSVHFESYKGHYIILYQRNHTWFCVYKRSAFELSDVGHKHHREIDESAQVPITCWDSASYFQKSLRDKGYRFEHLDRTFHRDYIHYGAFAKNTSITRRNVALFRSLVLLEHRLPGRIAGRARMLRRRLLPLLENNRYQWAREAPIQW